MKRWSLECCALLRVVCRDGNVSLQEYMAFMISRETENVKSSEEIESAFRALSTENKPYVTKEELYQVRGGRCCTHTIMGCNPVWIRKRRRSLYSSHFGRNECRYSNNAVQQKQNDLNKKTMKK